MAALSIVGGLLLIAASICWIIVLIDAFKNEVWKGILGFFCGLYLLYYAFVEYQAANKWVIVGIGLVGWIIGLGLIGASGMAGMASLPRTGTPLSP